MCTAQVRGGAGGSVKRDLCNTTHMRTGQRWEEGGGWQLRARVVPTQVLERSTRMSACFVRPDEIAQERAKEEDGGGEGGE